MRTALCLLAALLVLLGGCGSDEGDAPPARAVVPAVTGLLQDAAIGAINGAGLKVGAVTMRSSATAAAGLVISTSPIAGASVAPGAPVAMVVSSGPALAYVPPVVGDPQGLARVVITGAGLTVGKVSTRGDATAAFGTVLSQSPGAGSQVAFGSAVDLVVSNPCQPGGPPTVILDTPVAGAMGLTGGVCNVDFSRVKVVIYVLTNQWYVQPFVTAPFTNVASSGSWWNTTHPWDRIMVLLVDPAHYVTEATKVTNPALDAGVLAWAQYPSTGPTSLQFSGRTWGIKLASDPFDPGPNRWSNDPAAVSVTAEGLRLKIVNIDGKWQCAEIYLLESLGYGTYTVQVASRVDQLDSNTVAAPLFTYAAANQEMDFEYSGSGGLVGSPNNAQFVVQPYTAPGNIVRYVQPPTGQFTLQMDWREDQVGFRTWNGWADAPAALDLISQWSYVGPHIPPPGQERVHINLWLLNGSAPLSGVGDELLIRSFTYRP